MDKLGSADVNCIEDIHKFETIKINTKHLKDVFNPFIVIQLALSHDQYIYKKLPLESYKHILNDASFKKWLKSNFGALGVNSIASLKFMHENIVHGINGWYVGINLNCKLMINNKIIHKQLMLLDISMRYMNGFRIIRIMKMINFYCKFHHLSLPNLDPTV